MMVWNVELAKKRVKIKRALRKAGWTWFENDWPTEKLENLLFEIS